jgi:hypothetical protein
MYYENQHYHVHQMDSNNTGWRKTTMTWGDDDDSEDGRDNSRMRVVFQVGEGNSIIVLFLQMSSNEVADIVYQLSAHVAYEWINMVFRLGKMAIECTGERTFVWSNAGLRTNISLIAFQTWRWTGVFNHNILLFISPCPCNIISLHRNLSQVFQIRI